MDAAALLRQLRRLGLRKPEEPPAPLEAADVLRECTESRLHVDRWRRDSQLPIAFSAACVPAAAFASAAALASARAYAVGQP